MSSSDPWASFEEAVERQAVYLHGPLPPGPGVCRICRSAAAEGFERCYPCAQQLRSSSLTADAVVPISYAVKGTQHAHNLASYKFTQPSQGAQRALVSLGLLFLYRHRVCLEDAAGGRFTQLAVVPSTRARPGPHPLQSLIGLRTSLPVAAVWSTGLYPPEDRQFHPDRFAVATAPARARVLLMDDTWTTGARVQSLSHTLKSAGALSVVAVVLGRHVNPAHEGSKALAERVRKSPFDIGKCVLEG